MWVPVIAPDARRWVMQHVTGGRLLSGHFDAAVPGGLMWTEPPIRLPDETMRLEMRVEDATFTTFGGLPPITGAGGNIALYGSTFSVDLDRGEVQVPAGAVTLEAGTFAVPNLADRPAAGLIELELAGDAVALGQIADADPLSALARNEIQPSDLSGSGTASVSVRMPLREGMTESDVDWKVTVKTNNVSSTAPLEGRILTDANVTLTVSPDGVTVYGRAEIDGVDADLSMSMPLGGSQQASDRRVRLNLDDEARERLGVRLESVLSGAVAALVTDLPDGSHRYDLDMQRARVVIPGLGWSKGIGVPATLSFDLKPAVDGFAVDNMVFAGDGFGFSGTAQLDAGYNLVSADIGNLSLHTGDSLAIKLMRGPSGYGINARGTSLDLRGLIAHMRDRNAQAGGYPDLALDARIDQVVGFNGETITDAALSLVSIGGQPQKVSFAGALGPSSIVLEYSVTGGGTTLRASASDAGRFMRFTDLYARISGGRIGIAGDAGTTGPMVGTIEIADFDVFNEPAMKQALATANTANATTQVHFDRMLASFRKADQVVAIEDAVLSGPELGAAFAGRYDIATTSVSLTGTYLPAYPVNNLFGRIPILGLALGAGPREGLIGVTFKIDGPLSGPSVMINPLSAVAPGIFRKIFEFQ
jgi:hypothetical protein